MDFQAPLRNKKDGKWYLPNGEFAWWPTYVRPGQPFPREVPVLTARNFYNRRPDGSRSGDYYNTDKRLFDQWWGGFGLRNHGLVWEATKRAASQITGKPLRYQEMWKWEALQDAKTLAAVWNRTMSILGYDAE